MTNTERIASLEGAVSHAAQLAERNRTELASLVRATAAKMDGMGSQLITLRDDLSAGMRSGYARKTVVDGWYSSLWNDRVRDQTRISGLENFRDGLYLALKMVGFFVAVAAIFGLGTLV